MLAVWLEGIRQRENSCTEGMIKRLQTLSDLHGQMEAAGCAGYDWMFGWLAGNISYGAHLKALPPPRIERSPSH